MNWRKAARKRRREVAGVAAAVALVPAAIHFSPVNPAAVFLNAISSGDSSQSSKQVNIDVNARGARVYVIENSTVVCDGSQEEQG